MKKNAKIIMILVLALVLVACGKKSEWDLIDSDENLSSNTTTVMDCQTVIQNYLDSADKNGQWEVEIKAWDNIVVDYIWRLDDGTVFDTNIQSIAEACGTYNEARDYTAGLWFEVWAGQMIKWFDNWVLWMKV